MESKSFYKSKTFWAGIATVCTGVGMYVSGEQELQSLMVSVVGVVFTYLRLITNKPII